MTFGATSDNRVRVIVVDDSKTIRLWLTGILNADDRLRVVGEAASSAEARDFLRTNRVDVMTLDVEMPGISGIDFLKRLMTHKPMPVVMLSAYTEKGSNAVVKALSLGAIDCIEKPKSQIDAVTTRDICERVYQASKMQVTSLRTRRVAPASPRRDLSQEPWGGGVILLGASTGGVSALETLLSEIEGSPWPVVIAQHMPEQFLKSFARRLSDTFARTFLLAQDGHVLRSGQVVFALGRDVSTRLVKRRDGTVECQLGPPSQDAYYRPCVNDLFQSAADAQLNGLAGVLTGMGDDGAKGLLALRDAGFFTAVQNKSSSVVFGMPQAALELNAAMEQHSDDGLGRRFTELTTNARLFHPGRLR